MRGCEHCCEPEAACVQPRSLSKAPREKYAVPGHIHRLWLGHDMLCMDSSITYDSFACALWAVSGVAACVLPSLHGGLPYHMALVKLRVL